MLMLEFSLSFHNMDVTKDQLDEATVKCGSQCLGQHMEEDIPSEREISQRFMELWHEKGELLLYKAFVSRFPNCAVWYDQIVGSIPPVVEVEVITSETFDSHTDRSNTEHLLGAARNQEHECCRTEDQEHLSSNGNIKEHVYSCANNPEHIYTNKEHNDSNWKESRHKQTSSRKCKHSGFNNKESRCDESVIGEEHTRSSASNREHFHSDKENRELFSNSETDKVHLHVDSLNIEHVQQRDGDRKLFHQGMKVETTLHGSCNTQHSTYQDSNVQGNVHHATNMEKQFFSNSNECISNNCDARKEVCVDANSVISVSDQNGSCPKELPESREVTVKNGLIFEADIQTSGHLTEAGNCSFVNENCPDSGFSFEGDDSVVNDVSSFAGSGTSTVFTNGSISYMEKELVLQLPQEEHVHTLGSFADHGYTNRSQVSSLSGDYEDSFEGQDGGEDYGHSELIARLQEAHEDLKNQIFAYVRGIFSEWVRNNPHDDFDICSLDRDLLAVADTSMEGEVVVVEFMDEQ